MKKDFIFFSIVVSLINVSHSQSRMMEIGSFDYNLYPELGDMQIENYSTRVNFAKKFKKGALGLSISYDQHRFVFTNKKFVFDSKPYERIHTVRASIFYKYNINNSWSTTVRFVPTISSDFKNGIDSESFQFNSMISISKRWNEGYKESNLGIGFGYGTRFGTPRIFPFVSFSKGISEKWSYAIGLPQTSLNYQVNERNRLEVNAKFQGTFGNISSKVSFDQTEALEDTKLEYISLDLGVEYKYRIQPNWAVNLRFGYSPYNQLRILDADFDELYDFNIQSSLFISMGLKFNLNKMRNENKK